jgi:hypothetical protein
MHSFIHSSNMLLCFHRTAVSTDSAFSIVASPLSPLDTPFMTSARDERRVAEGAVLLHDKDRDITLAVEPVARQLEACSYDEQ